MNYVNINGIFSVSQVSLGTAEFGTVINDKDAFRQLDIFTDKGGNFVDTARVYAQWLSGGDGASERCIGSWISKSKNREKIIISDKGGHPSISSMNVSRLSPKDIQTDLNESLALLKTDYIDLYFLHRDDVNLPVSEIMDCLHEEVKSGKIRALGASNWTTKRINEANEYAKKFGKTEFSVSQIEWSLAELNEENKTDKSTVHMTNEEFAGYSEIDIPVMAFTSQARGFFSKYDIDKDSISQGLINKYLNSCNIERYKRIKKLALEKDATVAQIVLAVLIKQKIKTIPIISTKSELQLEESLKAFCVNLSEAEALYVWGK